MQKSSKHELIRVISNVIRDMSYSEKRNLFDDILGGDGVPVSCFNANISGLCVLICFLKDVKKKSFKEIAHILNRKLSTIYNTYNRSKDNFSIKLDISATYYIPVDIFADRKFSVLENLVSYMRGEGFSLAEISEKLGKNYSTIKTVNRRYKIKNA